MPTLADQIKAQVEQMRQALQANLEAGEELRWFSVATQYKAPAVLRFLLSWSILLPIFGPLVALFLEAQWYVGITSKRVIFGRIRRPFQPDPKSAVGVPLADVTVTRRSGGGGEFVVANATAGVPSKLRLGKKIDIDQVQAALGSSTGASS